MLKILILLVLFAIWALMEWHLYITLRNYFQSGNTGKNLFTAIWFAIPVISLLLIFMFKSFPRNIQVVVMNGVGIIIMSKIIAWIILMLGESVVWIVNRLTNETSDISTSRRKFLSRVTLAFLALPFSTLWYGLLKTSTDFKIHKLNLAFKRLPASFHGLKIVQISDIHTGSIIYPDGLRKAMEMIQQLKPDLILFTGDLVNNTTDEAYLFENTLSLLQAPLGVYSILGNHDYGDYHIWPDEIAKKKNMEEMIELHRRLGWKLLRNEHVVIEKDNNFIALLGVENWGAALRFPKYGDIQKAKLGLPNEMFKILMSHDPSHWDAQINEKEKDIDLTLSGHTHGFQFGVEIPGFKWSPSQYIYKQWAGLYRSGEQMIYVNRGLGCIGYSGRVGIRPEITLITLESQQS
ncbi:MAG: metallophosphoesterase [Flavobacteriales bacterium]|nr:metallophosphoesterase [Flavobacteriales bacterium]